MFVIDDFEFIPIDTDIIARVKEPRLGIVITFLSTDGSTMAADQRYELVQQGDQWFVLANNRLLTSRINESIEENSGEIGIDLARTLPLPMLMCSALDEFCDRYVAEQGDPTP